MNFPLTTHYLSLPHSPSSSNNENPTFPYFSSLPFELREQIWIFSLPGPRVIAYQKYFTELEYYYKLYAPAALLTNQESRAIALRYFTPRGPYSSWLRPFWDARLQYFDLKNDLFILENLGSAGDRIFPGDASWLEKEGNEIERIFMRYHSFNNSFNTPDCYQRHTMETNLTGALRWLKGVKEIVLEIHVKSLWEPYPREEMDEEMLNPELGQIEERLNLEVPFAAEIIEDVQLRLLEAGIERADLRISLRSCIGRCEENLCPKILSSMWKENRRKAVGGEKVLGEWKKWRAERKERRNADQLW